MAVPHDIDRLERIRHVTANYLDYQGLYTSLFGVFLIFLVFMDQGRLEALILGVPVVVTLNILIRRHYRKRFGDVRPLRSPNRTLVQVGVTVLVLGGFLAAVVIANAFDRQGLWIYGLLLMGLLVLTAGWHWRMRPHYLVSAAVALVLFVLPLGALTPSGSHPFEITSPNVLLLVVAVMFVVNGLLDHRTLVRTLRPVAESETD
ncbi:hypothetical protein [Nocardiopsis ganjiahuensis]|uniref:hypothetical protein n=1 Tax=Nocardiopsis ganjiahuensis TaxID=239984 RepID=UPI0003498CD3|nr:hypothetical protein [Nocardiopsis ganjiahuensis]